MVLVLQTIGKGACFHGHAQGTSYFKPDTKELNISLIFRPGEMFAFGACVLLSHHLRDIQATFFFLLSLPPYQFMSL